MNGRRRAAFPFAGMFLTGYFRAESKMGLVFSPEKQMSALSGMAQNGFFVILLVNSFQNALILALSQVDNRKDADYTIDNSPYADSFMEDNRKW